MKPFSYFVPFLAAVALLSPLRARGEPPVLQLHKDKGVVAHSGLDPLYQRFYRAYHELDVDAAASVYSDDALYLAPGEGVRSGRAAIREGFAAQFAKARQKGRHLFLRFGILQRRVDGNLAYDVGIATLSTSGQDGFYSQNSLKFVVVARKHEGGGWRWQVDSYSGLFTPKSGEPDTELGKSVGQTVTLRGTARDAKGGAVLLLATGEPVYLRGLDSWPKDLSGKTVLLTGLLRNEKYLPEAVVGKDGAISQGATGSQWVVENPSFKTAD